MSETLPACIIATGVPPQKAQKTGNNGVHPGKPGIFCRPAIRIGTGSFNRVAKRTPQPGNASLIISAQAEGVVTIRPSGEQSV